MVDLEGQKYHIVGRCDGFFEVAPPAPALLQRIIPPNKTILYNPGFAGSGVSFAIDTAPPTAVPERCRVELMF